MYYSQKYSTEVVSRRISLCSSGHRWMRIQPRRVQGDECPNCEADQDAVERTEAQEAVQAQRTPETASQVPAGSEEFGFGNAPRSKGSLAEEVIVDDDTYHHSRLAR
jgi:hypothetical protein